VVAKEYNIQAPRPQNRKCHLNDMPSPQRAQKGSKRSTEVSQT